MIAGRIRTKRRAGCDAPHRPSPEKAQKINPQFNEGGFTMKKTESFGFELDREIERTERSWAYISQGNPRDAIAWLMECKAHMLWMIENAMKEGSIDEIAAIHYEDEVNSTINYLNGIE